MFLADIIERTGQCWGQQLSLVEPKRSFRWHETRDRIRRLASGLSELAEGRGRCVAVLGLLGIEYFELSFAIPVSGLTFVPVNNRLTPAELGTLLGELDVAAIVYGPELHDKVSELRGSIDCAYVAWGQASALLAGERDYEELVASSEPRSFARPSLDDPWAIVFSGGTTGLPKGVRLTNRAIGFNTMTALQDLPWEESCRFLLVSPLFHLAGLGPSFAATALGATISFLPDFSPDALLKALEHGRCTCVGLVPTMINMMLRHPDLERFDLSNLRSICYGASSITVPTLQRMLELFPDVALTQFYGQTECCGGLTSLTAIHHSTDATLSHRLASAGRAVKGGRVVILDPDGQELPAGERGEICGWSPGVFEGYVGHDALTASVMRDGLLHTGDVGYMDEDGFVYVTDRLKDMIVTGGENVSSSEVETAIASYPGVDQVAVVAAPDDLWGERVHAFVVTRLGDDFDVEAMKIHCRGRIAGYKIPKSVTVRREGLPLSAVGKIRKDMLREELALAAS